MRPAPRCLVLLVLLLLPPLPAAEPQEDAEKLARELVQLRVETVRAETAWRTERELVASTVAALQEKAALAEEKLELTKAKTARDREEFDALLTKVQGARDDLKVFETRLAALVVRLAALRPSLPPRLSAALEMSYRTLADSAQPPAERMRIALNVLNRCAQFNRVVTTGEDVLALEGVPAPKSLEVIYWGLSRGYAIDRAGRKAWLGWPGSGGWHWEAQPGAFDRVKELIAIASDQADPAFVFVPAPGPKVPAETAGRQTP